MRISPYYVRQALKNAYRLPLFELARHSRFFVPLIPVRPLQGVIYLTENCNSRCVHCSFWRQKPQNELTTGEVASALTQLRGLGVDYLCLTGGEPLLRHDLAEIIRTSARLRFGKIQLLTNALLLKQERAEELLSSGVNRITISLNGVGDTHDTSRGVPGSYLRCLEALENLVHLRKSRYPSLQISVTAIVMKSTLDELEDLTVICQQLGVTLGLVPIDNRSFYHAGIDISDLMIDDPPKLDRVVVELHRMVRKYPDLIDETHTSLEYLRTFFRDPIRKEIPCYLGHLAVHIGPHGEVYSGCEALPPVGNIRESSLAAITQSSKYRKRLAHMFAKHCPGCACGIGLNLYCHAPTLVEEAMWMLRLRNPGMVGSPVTAQLQMKASAYAKSLHS